MRGIGTVIAASAILGLVAACSTFETQEVGQDFSEIENGREGSYSPTVHRPTDYNGMTAVRVVFDETSGAPAVVELISGKEAEDVEITYKKPDGTEVTYSANGLAAFEGQATRAQVEQVLAAELGDLWTEMVPEVRSLLTDALEKLISGGVL